MSEWTLCIDFGTAFSKAAVAPRNAWAAFDPAQLRPLLLSGADGPGNPFLLDSAIFVDDDRVLFGKAALLRANELADAKRAALRSFKTMLSVSDLDRALNTNAPLTIDPHRVFQLRDLIVLYLAFLLASIDRAFAADPVLAGVSNVARRYAAPAWRTGDSAGTHDSILLLFGEAEAFRQAAGKKLLATDGLSMKFIGDALPKATAAASAFEMGLIFEATAAAAYTSVGIAKSSAHTVVVDMGAGTTDIAALARVGERTIELPEARVTLKQAGDFMDRVIANRILDSAGWTRGPEQKSELWAVLMRQMGDIKETVFAEGAATLRHQGRVIKLTMRDIERDADFRSFKKSLEDAYSQSLAIVRADAKKRRQREVQAVAVGGGAHAPFIQELVRKSRGGGPRVVTRPVTPDWANANVFQGNLAPVFSQLAIAIGGAIAPDEMLAAHSGLIPLHAAGQTGIQPARD